MTHGQHRAPEGFVISADRTFAPASQRGAPREGTAQASPGEIDQGALDAFAETVTGTFTAQDVLAQLTRAIAEVLGVDGAGVMAPVEQAAETVGAGGGLLRFAYAHGRLEQTIIEVEELQELLHEGPCRDSHDQGRVINLADLAVEGSWPPYQARAADVGLRAVAAIPLRARGRGWGVLDLYRSQARRLSPGELAAAQTLANLATSYLWSPPTARLPNRPRQR